MSTTTEARKIMHVTVEHTGGQLTLDDSDVPLRSSRGKIGLHLVADVLSDPAAWIEYDTEVTWAPNEDAQPWEIEHRPDRSARGRLYGRGVSQVLTVYDEPA